LEGIRGEDTEKKFYLKETGDKEKGNKKRKAYKESTRRQKEGQDGKKKRIGILKKKKTAQKKRTLDT